MLRIMMILVENTLYTFTNPCFPCFMTLTFWMVLCPKTCQIALADGQSIAKEPLEFEDFVLWPKRSSKMVCFWLTKMGVYRVYHEKWRLFRFHGDLPCNQTWLAGFSL